MVTDGKCSNWPPVTSRIPQGLRFQAAYWVFRYFVCLYACLYVRMCVIFLYVVFVSLFNRLSFCLFVRSLVHTSVRLVCWFVSTSVCLLFLLMSPFPWSRWFIGWFRWLGCIVRSLFCYSCKTKVSNYHWHALNKKNNVKGSFLQILFQANQWKVKKYDKQMTIIIEYIWLVFIDVELRLSFFH